MRRRIISRVFARRDEQGAILILSVLFLVVMVVCAALAIDLGFLDTAKRSDHKMADLASLDAIRHFDDITPCVAPGDAQRSHITDVATQSAENNGYDPSVNGSSITVKLGVVDTATKTFTESANACDATAVFVTVGSDTAYRFVPGHQGTTAAATASRVARARYSLGSFLGSLSSDDSAILNSFVGRMITGNNSNLNLTLASWQGLMSANVNLEKLRQHLASGGVDVGTPDKFMSSQMTVTQLGTATAQALTDDGYVAQANAFNAIVSGAKVTQHVTMGQIMKLNEGDGTAVDFSTQAIPAMQLVTAAAVVANGANFVSVPNLAVTLPLGVGSISATLSAISAPEIIDWAAPLTAASEGDTNQLDFTVTPVINKAVTVAGLVGATVTGSLPIHVTGGGAHSTLENAICPSLVNPSIKIGVDPKAVTAASTGTMDLNANVPLVGTTSVAHVGVNANQTTTGTHGDLTFNYPAEFSPPAGTKRTGSTTVGLSGGAGGGGYSVTNVTLGSPPLLTANLAQSTVLGAIDPIITAVDQVVMSRIAVLLGLHIGGADVGALGVDCNGFQLVS
jgi:uncharacterized membrane protein